MSTSSSRPENKDDFKLIHGIGPGIEIRLYSAHIYTYAQLAALTPHILAQKLQGLAGLTAKRIAEQDWIGQARKFATEQAEEWAEQAEEGAKLPPSLILRSDTEGEVGEESLEFENMAPESRKHYDNFTVELLLDDDNAVSRTRVLHVQERTESAWNGWEGQMLINFIEEHAGLRSVERNEIHLEPALAAASEPAATGLVGEKSILGLANQRSQFFVKMMEVSTANNPRSGHILSRGQPFHIHLALELSQVEAPPGTLLGYSAKVFAKDLSKGTHLLVGADQGELLLAKQANIEIEGNPLPVGIYHLDTIVTLSQQSGAAPRTKQTAFLDGGVFQVY